MGKVASQCPVSMKMDVNNNNNLTFDSLENLEKCITPESVKKQGFKASGSSSKAPVASDNHLKTGVDGVEVIQMEQLSPPLSCSDPNSNHKDSVRYSLKRPAEKDASGAKSHNPDGKRLKETDDGSDDMKLERNGHKETNNLSSENVATASCNSETESKRPVSGGQSDQLDLNNNPCAFCQCSKISEGSGALMAYAHGKEVKVNVSNFAKVTYAHEKCTEWAPQIYFQKGKIWNLDSEVARASKLKCTSCGKKGAVLGCYVKSCKNTYHVPCAYDILDCRWDCNDFLLLCPNHASHKFPREKKSKARKQVTDKILSTNLNQCTTLPNEGKNLVLCGSALSAEQKFTMVDFARANGALVSKYWKDNVTHVIAATDANGACTRTLKVLMAILNGKWVVTMECTAPKLFNNIKFYFVGDFVQAFKSDLLNLVKTAGGTISETKDQLLSSDYGGLDLDQTTYVVYNADMSICAELENEDTIKDQRLAAAEGVAEECGSRVVGHTWILESIAACSLLPLTSRV
ncbi:hypothetical protein M8C21_006565 [Ambrosia artemisiifolia]|uniref:PHD-type domain-containing protein n=1 Tax=Ambrosia artemisiifolia TaxID=4212 RepID=A0AAD5G7C2_AMBAR|nr:hypothetical protein M8C21_006565 [Ambrosia artemisiifolia]